jgi:hypothetical protein
MSGGSFRFGGANYTDGTKIRMLDRFQRRILPVPSRIFFLTPRKATFKIARLDWMSFPGDQNHVAIAALRFPPAAFVTPRYLFGVAARCMGR